jgi:hypothetical protein
MQLSAHCRDLGLSVMTQEVLQHQTIVSLNGVFIRVQMGQPFLLSPAQHDLCCGRGRSQGESSERGAPCLLSVCTIQNQIQGMYLKSPSSWPSTLRTVFLRTMSCMATLAVLLPFCGAMTWVARCPFPCASKDQFGDQSAHWRSFWLVGSASPSTLRHMLSKCKPSLRRHRHPSF